MSTWKIVFQLEWTILKRDRSAMSVLLLFAAFLIAAAIAGGNHASELAESLAKSQLEEQERIESLSQELTALTGTQKPLRSQNIP